MNGKLDITTTTEKMEHPRLPIATEGATAVIPSKEGCNNRANNRQSNHQSAEPMKCPRCDSANTKFCYYNNYSLSQPRYFCKACRRYWTQGGTLRNVPVGGGCRKTKRVKTFRPSSVMDGFNPSCNPMQFINSHLDNIGAGFLNGLQHPSLPLMLHGFPPLPAYSSDLINENHHLQRFGLTLSHMQEDEESMRSENTPSLISPYDIAGGSITGITDHSDPSILHSQNSLLHHDLSTTLDQTSLLKQLSNYSSCPPDLSLLFENTTNNNNTVVAEDEQQHNHFRAFTSANLGLSSSLQAGLETQLQLQQPKQGFHLMSQQQQQQQQYQHKVGERDEQILSEERVQEHLERLKAKALLSHISNQQTCSSSNNNNHTNNTTGEPTHWVPQTMLQNGVSTTQIRAEQSWSNPWQAPNYN